MLLDLNIIAYHGHSGAMLSEINGNSTVYSIDSQYEFQRKRQSSVLLALCEGIHQ